jgi:hypothetical protein
LIWQRLAFGFELMGCEVEFRSYPGWTPMQSQKFRCFVPIYEKQNGDKPRVGLSRGSRMWNIRTNYPDGYDFGPTNERTLQMKSKY